MSHSPLPWSVSRSNRGAIPQHFQPYVIVDANGWPVIEEIGTDDTAKEKAELVVKAVNSHAKFTCIIEAIMNDCDDFHTDELDMTAIDLIDAIRHACFNALQSPDIDNSQNPDVPTA